MQFIITRRGKTIKFKNNNFELVLAKLENR